MSGHRKGLTAVELQRASSQRAEYAMRLYSDGWPLARIGKMLGVTRERVRQIICWHLRAQIREFSLYEATRWRDGIRPSLRDTILLMAKERQAHLETPVSTADLKILAGAPILRRVLLQVAS